MPTLLERELKIRTNAVLVGVRKFSSTHDVDVSGYI